MQVRTEHEQHTTDRNPITTGHTHGGEVPQIVTWIYPTVTAIIGKNDVHNTHIKNLLLFCVQLL